VIVLDPLREARSLRQELVPPSAAHFTRALDLQQRIRVLDGLYVVLAQDREATLVTTDERLASAQLPVPVRAPGRA
jgi:predicted nucleic acid-binding protein